LKKGRGAAAVCQIQFRAFTQQDIVAEALTTWLQKNGYGI